VREFWIILDITIEPCLELQSAVMLIVIFGKEGIDKIEIIKKQKNVKIL